MQAPLVIFFIATLLVTAQIGFCADAPPPAPVRPVVDDYHGAKISDPYRYMENLADPEVQSWMKTQAEYARQKLSTIPGRERLFNRIVELDSGAAFRLRLQRRLPNGDLLYLKCLASENIDKLYVRDGKTEQERLLVDPDRFIAPGKAEHYALEFCIPSPDGRFVAYGIAASGSEQTTLHVIDIATAKDLADTIDRMEAEYMPPCWLPDGNGFVYSRRRKLPADAPPTEVYKQSKSFIHKLGADPERDPTLFAMNSAPNVLMGEADFPGLYVSPGSPHVIAQIKHGDTPELTLYTAPFDLLTARPIPWKRICDIDQEVTEYQIHGDDIYLLTASSAPRYKILRTSLNDPDLTSAQTVVPQSAAVIESIAVARDGLYVGSLEGGLRKIWRIAFAPPPEPGPTWQAKPEPIELPAGSLSASISLAQHDVDGIHLVTHSWTRGAKSYAFDPTTHTLSETHLQPEGKYDNIDGYEAHEVQVPSHDGVLVPLSIIHKTGIKLDGSHPTLVNGYGGYGMTIAPHFIATRLAWLERGGVLAFAHVRGGGDFGREWHMAGRKATKPNTWKDFIACCEYLVQKNYTTPAKLAGQGGSAGGILIGRAVTERPDLFAAALINVGCLDLLRSETTTNGVPNIPEFGTITSQEGFDALYAMSSYHHVKDGTKYPAVLLTCGINDPRVEPWESAKMTARLQAASASDKPILFRVDYDAGHGVGSTKRQRQEELADEWAFLLWQMGEPEFRGQ